MAEPARKLPEETTSPKDPDVFYINGAQPDDDLEEEVDITEEQDNDTIDIRDQIEDRLEKEKQSAEQAEKVTQPEVEKPPVQEPAENPELTQRKKEKIQDEAERAKDAKQKLEKTTDNTSKTIGREVGGAAEKEAAAASRQGARAAARTAAKAAQEGTKKAAQWSAKLAARAGTALVEFFATPPGWITLGIILLVVIIFAIILAFFAFSGDTGNGPAQYPETALQKQQSNFLLAISGDKISQDIAVKEVVDSELARYERIKTSADTYNPELSASVAARKTELDAKLTALLVEQGAERRLVLRDQLRAEMLSFESTLPFGSWIAKLAEARVGQPNLQFCNVTKVKDAKVACASFTSTVMYLAGVPNPIVKNTTAVWENSALKVVIDRSPTPTTSQYDQSKLQPGDIIWWGNGTCSSVKYPGKLFDHVGFYVGNGEAIDTSSSEEKVLKRPAASRDGCRVFNGAKRYGS